MSHKTTVLGIQRQREFLEAQRQDPVTRKVFVAGDRITLCATCLLPFLEESWRAIGGMHCGQSATISLEASESAAETPAGRNGVDSGAAKTDEDTDGSAAAGPNDEAPGLRSIPIELREVPIALR